MPAKIEALFPSKLYRAEFGGVAGQRLRAGLEQSARTIARDDKAGRAWCREHRYKGYTSYASLDDLAWRDPLFAELITNLDDHVAAFAVELDLDLGRQRLAIDSIWINILKPGGAHAGHIHPLSVVSGTYYVSVPAGASALRLEDPRLAMLMASPPRKAQARLDNRAFVEVMPKPGTVLLWESFLRHEVPANEAAEERISISFNYHLAARAERSSDEP